MTDITKRFRWGLSVLVILHHFSTPEVRALLRYCRKLIKDFCNPAYEGEGYRATIIAFEMFEYGFVLAHDRDAEEWVLDIVAFPRWDSPHCRRKPPSDDRVHERAVEAPGARSRPDLAQLMDELKTTLRATYALGSILRNLLAHTAAELGRVAEMLRRSRISRSSHERAAPIIEMFTRLAEQQSYDYVEVVQLVRAKVSSAVWFLGPLWTFPLPRLRRVSFELWEVSLFGALPEHPSG